MGDGDVILYAVDLLRKYSADLANRKGKGDDIKALSVSADINKKTGRTVEEVEKICARLIDELMLGGGPGYVAVPRPNRWTER